MLDRIQTVQRNMVNDVVKESDDVKVITLRDGSVQVVGINETNADDGRPFIDPIAEITVDSGPFDVAQTEHMTDALDVDEHSSPALREAHAQEKRELQQQGEVVVDEDEVVHSDPATPPLAPPNPKANKTKTNKTVKADEVPLTSVNASSASIAE